MPNYHFSLLGQDGRAIDAVDLACPDDEAALHHARSLLPLCHAVEFLRGGRLLGQVVNCSEGPAAGTGGGQKPRAQRWWFQASPPPAWLDRKTGAPHD